MVPPYFDELIEAYRHGAATRSVHLGYWRDGDDGDFAGAQARLDRLVIELADMRNGQAVLDVACGFGGTLAAINDTHHAMRLAGVNIDERQLEICRGITARAGNQLTWHLADAVRLPFTGAAFDRVFCIEALFHFASRRRFFAEAVRVLKPGGVLAGTDILISPAARPAPFPIEAILQAGFGPWPEVWGDDVIGETRDITAQIAPSHRYTARPDADPADARLPAPARASAALRWLQDRGWLRYIAFRFERPHAAEAAR